ncbi:hypothetical protein ACVWWJ_002443 [Luteibacter sp. HA06]
MVGSVIRNIPHGILFVMDPGNQDVLIPEYVEHHLVASNDSCLSIATQAPCDGDTEVSLILHGSAPLGLFRLGVWDLGVPNGVIAVTTSDDEMLFECQVPIGHASMSVWVDDHRWPAKVCINIEPSFEDFDDQNVHRIGHQSLAST